MHSSQAVISRPAYRGAAVNTSVVALSTAVLPLHDQLDHIANESNPSMFRAFSSDAATLPAEQRWYRKFIMTEAARLQEMEQYQQYIVRSAHMVVPSATLKQEEITQQSTPVGDTEEGPPAKQPRRVGAESDQADKVGYTISMDELVDCTNKEPDGQKASVSALPTKPPIRSYPQPGDPIVGELTAEECRKSFAHLLPDPTKRVKWTMDPPLSSLTRRRKGQGSRPPKQTAIEQHFASIKRKMSLLYGEENPKWIRGPTLGAAVLRQEAAASMLKAGGSKEPSQ